jgi:hypothetical protein
LKRAIIFSLLSSLISSIISLVGGRQSLWTVNTSPVALSPEREKELASQSAM